MCRSPSVASLAPNNTKGNSDSITISHSESCSGEGDSSENKETKENELEKPKIQEKEIIPKSSSQSSLQKLLRRQDSTSRRRTQIKRLVKKSVRQKKLQIPLFVYAVQQMAMPMLSRQILTESELNQNQGNSKNEPAGASKTPDVPTKPENINSTTEATVSRKKVSWRENP